MSPSTPAEITRAILASVAGGEPAVTATVIAAPDGAPLPLGAKILVRPGAGALGSLGGGPLQAAVLADCRAAFRRHSMETRHYLPNGEKIEHPSRTNLADRPHFSVLIEVFEPPLALLIVGGGHIGKALSQIGSLLGFSVAIVDERPEYCNPERFPEAERLLCGDYAEMLQNYPITPNTFIVLVTRGHKQDELSLRQVIDSPARYIGMIGSKRRVSAVLQHIIADGVPEGDVQKVRTPIGLDIGAETPEEIAVAVMAEIIHVRRGGSCLPMAQLARVTQKVTAGASRQKR